MGNGEVGCLCLLTFQRDRAVIEHQGGTAVSAGPLRKGEPAWEVAYLFPSQGDWTEEEYLALDTNRLVELSDGCLEVLAMPTIFHQLIVAHLHDLLHRFIAGHGIG